MEPSDLSGDQAALSLVLTLPATFAERGMEDGLGDTPAIYPVSQGLHYDSGITANRLPPHGPFQKLAMGAPMGLRTAFSPGGPGYACIQAAAQQLLSSYVEITHIDKHAVL